MLYVKLLEKFYFNCFFYEFEKINTNVLKERYMKRFLTVLAVVILFSASANAEPVDAVKRSQPLDKTMKMDPNCTMANICPMNGDKPMPMKNPIFDTMLPMVDIIKMQQKIIKGVNPSEKKALLKEIDKKIVQMESMAYMPCVQPPPSVQENKPTVK